MRFGYTILYVPDVPKALHFYEKAFGIKQKFLHESNQYGELETDSVALAFVCESLIEESGISFTPNKSKGPAAGFEIAFVTENVNKAYNHAVSSGAQPVKEPLEKPWGQTVAYVRDLNGILVEICSPMGS